MKGIEKLNRRYLLSGAQLGNFEGRGVGIYNRKDNTTNGLILNVKCRRGAAPSPPVAPLFALWMNLTFHVLTHNIKGNYFHLE